MCPHMFGCGFSLPLVSGVICPLRVPFVVLHNIRVAPIYAVNVVAAVLACVNIYVVLM